MACVLVISAGAWAAGVVVDNDDGAPAYVETGAWATSGLTGYNGGTYKTSPVASPEATATWTPTILTAATYEVFAIFRTGGNRTPAAPHTVTHANGVTLIPIDQTGGGNIEERNLGEFLFNAGTGGSVQLGTSGPTGFHISDAMRFAVPVNDPPMITGLAISPELPASGEAVIATATITDSDSAVASAEIVYSAQPSGAMGTAEALDDGLSGDGAAGDGVWGGVIPSFDTGEEINFRFRAADVEGLTASSEAYPYAVGLLEDSNALVTLLSGQSNASGRGPLDENTEAPDAHVVLFGNDYVWKIASEPIDSHVGQIDAVSDDFVQFGITPRHGFGLRAAKDLVAAGSSSVRVIPAPLGGTNLSQWRRGADPLDRTTLFGSMNFRRQTAAPSGLDALWWYQGESNAGSDTYIAEHTALVGEMREEMGAALPILYVQLARRDVQSSNTQETAEDQRLMETGSGDASALAAHHLVVAFDQALIDSVHIDAAGQREVGRRMALATREHVLGDAVDGTGPRLRLAMPIVHPGDDLSLVQVRLTQPINAAVNGYDNQFRVFDDGGEVTISNVVRDPIDDSAVLITLAAPITGTPTVSYGNTGGSTLLTNVVVGANALPLPRFGPLPVELGSVAASISGFSAR